MHDPMSVAHEIYLFGSKTKSGRYKTPILTIWHVDPEKDGTDDSCGWFIRKRHLDKNILDKIEKEFIGEWDNTHRGENGYVYNCGWFNAYGENVLSVRGIVLNMYLYAAKILLNPDDKKSPRKAWELAWKFINKHYAEIMYFAENNRDSMRDIIVRKFQIGCDMEYTPERRAEMIKECVSIIACDIARKLRPWYKHPRWHIHHWRFQFPHLQKIKRRYWDKCSICGRRGFKNSAMSDWDGTKIRHQECDRSIAKPQNTVI